MKIGPQVYVRGSVEAVEMYCKAFGAEISFQIKDKEKNTYMHCELSVNGQLFMAVSEAPDNCDVSKKKVCGKPWRSMHMIWAAKKLYAMHMTYCVMVVP